MQAWTLKDRTGYLGIAISDAHKLPTNAGSASYVGQTRIELRINRGISSPLRLAAGCAGVNGAAQLGDSLPERGCRRSIHPPMVSDNGIFGDSPLTDCSI
jgi:hypothetical protein